MGDWAHGDFGGPFEERLDALLSVLCPGWEMPPYLGDPGHAGCRAYGRRNAKRSRLGAELRRQPREAGGVAGQVLDAIVHDEHASANRQLIEPLLISVGRRAVQEYLITVITSGSTQHKVCAVRAWYWSQPVMVYPSREAWHARQPTAASETRLRKWPTCGFGTGRHA